MKQTYTILLVFIFSTCLSFAQNNTVALGGEAIGSGGTISYSVGQIDYIHITEADGILTLGVQQPYEIYTLGEDDFPEIRLQMAVYPNPTASDVYLTLGGYTSAHLSYTLFDLRHRFIASKRITQDKTHISLENLPAATYLLQVKYKNKNLKSFKIIVKR